MLNNTKKDVIYASVLSDGRIHVTVPEGTEGAVLRTYETSDKKKGSKWELVYTELTGMITNIAFRDGDFGSQFQIEVTDGDNKPVVLSLGTASNFGEDMMKKIMNVDMKENVKIVPFSFTDDKKKNRRGVTIYQINKKTKKAERVTNYFYDAEKKKNINGYPEPKKLKKPLTKDQWKLYFAEAREFLVETITEHFKLGDPVEDKNKKEVDDFDTSNAESEE